MLAETLAAARAARREGDLATAASLARESMWLAPDRTEPAIEAGWVALEAGKPDEAVGLAQRALRLEPDHPEALSLLAAALIAAGEPERASAIRERLAAVDASHPTLPALAAQLDAARDALPLPYLRTLFDQYAPRFDAALAALGYRVPALLADRLAQLLPDGARPTVLDLGCGTGLVASAVAPRAASLDGIDLSPLMIARAGATGLYRTLEVGDLLTWLPLQSRRWDVAVAGDVLAYFGALEPLLAATRAVLPANGLFLASAEAAPDAGADAILRATRRFAHRGDYLRRALQAAGFAPLALEPAVLRTEARRPVDGWIVAARAQ